MAPLIISISKLAPLCLSWLRAWFCSPSFASFLFPSALIVMFGSVRGRRLLTLPSWRGHEIPDGGYRFIVGCGSLTLRVLEFH